MIELLPALIYDPFPIEEEILGDGKGSSDWAMFQHEGEGGTVVGAVAGVCVLPYSELSV